MRTDPVYVPRASYRGSNAAKRRKVETRNALAAKLETYINEQASVAKGPHLMLSYAAIAQATNVPLDQVCDILFPVDAGSDGITIFEA